VVTTYNNCNYQLVGIGEEMATPQFSAYPNPTNGQLWLNLEESNNAMVRITDSSGRCVFEGKYDGNAIDLSKFSNGLYSLLLQTTGGSSTRKLIIQK
jgi:hypothetical protein